MMNDDTHPLQSRQEGTNGVIPAGYGQFAALVEHSPDAILRFDSDQRYIFANRTAERYLGVAADKLLGARIGDLQLGGDQVEAWNAALERVFDTGEPTSFEYAMQTRRGERFFEVRLVPERESDGAFDTVLVVGRDVTKEKHHRRRLEESEDRWRRLIDYNPESIVVFAEDRIVYANRATARLYGVEHPADLIGRSVYDFFSAEDYTDVQRRLSRLYAGTELDPHHYRLIRSDGREVDVDVYSVPIRYAGKNAVQSVMRDVSEQREYEQKLIEARLRAEEVARLKSSIVTNLSHEIRTPLANVLGFTEVLREHVDDQGGQMIDIIEHGIERLMATLTAVLELGRLESGDGELTPSEVDVTAVLRRAIDEAQPLAEKNNVTIELAASSESFIALLDPDVLYDIVWRLVDNAFKFTQDGSVVVRLEANDADTCITVEDSGIGISTEFLPHLFDEFEQESKGMDRNYEGVGLGLSIVKRLIDLSGARITVESSRGTGSSFCVTFPNTLSVTA